MILGQNILYKLKIDLLLSDNIIKVNGGTYEGLMDPIKDFQKSTSKRHLIGLNMRYPRTKNYGIANMC